MGFRAEVIAVKHPSAMQNQSFMNPGSGLSSF